MTGGSTGGSRGKRSIVGVAVCLAYGLLAWALLWPLFANPANTVLDPDRPWLSGLVDPKNPAPATIPMLRDMRLLQWIYAWDWHALVTAPRSLFEANMFHPTPHALAYSEHSLGKVVLAGPIFALSGNPVLAFQLDLWLGFALSGGALYALLRHAGARPAAAFVGGFVYAFAPVRLEMLFHSHLMSGQYLPLALLFLDRALFGGNRAAATWFGLFLMLHMLCSFYLAYMALVGVPIYALGLLLAGRRRVTRGGMLRVAIAGAVVLGVIGALSRVYLTVRASGALIDYGKVARGLHALSNEPWRAYLLPPSLAASEGWRLTRGCYAYLGALPLALAVVGVSGLRRGRGGEVARRTTSAATLLAVASWVLALGPVAMIGGHEVTLPYGVAMQVVPGFSSMRVPGRFALLMLVGFSALVGLGLERVLRAAERTRPAVRPWLPAAIALLVALTAWDFGVTRTTFAVRRETLTKDREAVYEALAGMPPGALLEIPSPGPGAQRPMQYQVQSVRHWKPLLTGSSGYYPTSYRFVMMLVGRLPDPAALSMLVRLTGLRYVVVHEDDLTPAEQRRWAAPPDLELVAAYGPDRLYRVDPALPADLVSVLVACAREAAACAEVERLIKY